MMKSFGNLSISDQICLKILKRFHQMDLRIYTLITSKMLNTNLKCSHNDFYDGTFIIQALFFFFFSFSICVFFHEHSRFTRQRGKGEAISLSSLYHFHLLHGHLDTSRAITAESSPLHIASSRTQTGNLCFPSASR